MRNNLLERQHVARLIERHVEGGIKEDDLDRMLLTVKMLPKASGAQVHLIDVGGTIHWLPVYVGLLGYAKVTFINRPEYVFSDLLRTKTDGLFRKFDVIDCDIDLERFDLPSDSASIAVCFEVLEHLPGDPMNMISQVGRILEDKGIFIMSTPNVLYKMNVLRFLFGRHPFSWSVYTCRYADRHNREFTPAEVACLLRSGGFSIDKLLTLSAPATGTGLGRLIASLLCLAPALTGHVPFKFRNQQIFAVARKQGPVKDRYPRDLYQMYGFDHVILPGRRTSF